LFVSLLFWIDELGFTYNPTSSSNAVSAKSGSSGKSKSLLSKAKGGAGRLVRV
jgi:hypothetical protein